MNTCLSIPIQNSSSDDSLMEDAWPGQQQCSQSCMYEIECMVTPALFVDDCCLNVVRTMLIGGDRSEGILEPLERDGRIMKCFYFHLLKLLITRIMFEHDMTKI
ncbi:hypothetical protein O6P43_029847 [Quillaja saponaria]|uniref:Uncharacterized protein n=1 Tax=Quillaja saponaria TaxID=32244 RepID=A0AAD7L0U0_QUISA|nr:hypothetical protein O6P43_029847 [Quillaja saponaria]